MSDAPLPPMRPVDVTPFEGDNGEPYFALVDQLQIATRPLAVSYPAVFILAHLDGETSCEQIRGAFARHFGLRIEDEQILSLVRTLDEHLYLANDRFEAAYRERAAAYAAAEVRDNTHRYPPADELRAQIRQTLGEVPPAGGKPPAGLVAPHLDYPRGGPCYRDAYHALGREPHATRFVILGTNHFGRSLSAVATRKDFLTPLGRVETDRAFLERVAERVGEGLFEREFDHAAEHSIELQIHILQELCGDRPMRIVPILCPDPTRMIIEPTTPQVARALADLLAEDDEPTVVIAGADLSHVGRHFGDPQQADERRLAQVARHDRHLLDLLVQRKEQDFLETLDGCDNATRICSIGCLYATFRALPQARAKLLRYHQATDFESDTHVSCAAMVLE